VRIRLLLAAVVVITGTLISAGPLGASTGRTALTGSSNEIASGSEHTADSGSQAGSAACVDPTPSGGGVLVLSGYGTPNHTATVQGDLCPGASDTWSFSTLYAVLDEHVGIKVTEKIGPFSIVVSPSDAPDVALAPGAEYRDIGELVTYQVTITGGGDALSSYRLHVCRALTPCVFSEGVTPRFAIADVDCGGSINAIDAALVLQLSAGLVSVLDCMDAADLNFDHVINAIDAALILQIDAGLIPPIT
jgi:hypothetical protein